jgi:hypothetical protein
VDPTGMEGVEPPLKNIIINFIDSDKFLEDDFKIDGWKVINA